MPAGLPPPKSGKRQHTQLSAAAPAASPFAGGPPSLMAKVGVAAAPSRPGARGHLPPAAAAMMPGPLSAASLGGVTPVAPFDWDKFSDAVSFFFSKLIALEEFDSARAAALVSPSLLRFATSKLWHSARPAEQQFLKVTSPLCAPCHPDVWR